MTRSLLQWLCGKLVGVAQVSGESRRERRTSMMRWCNALPRTTGQAKPVATPAVPITKFYALGLLRLPYIGSRQPIRAKDAD
jgi:hypothetical protein